MSASSGVRSHRPSPRFAPSTDPGQGGGRGSRRPPERCPVANLVAGQDSCGSRAPRTLPSLIPRDRPVTPAGAAPEWLESSAPRAAPARPGAAAPIPRPNRHHDRGAHTRSRRGWPRQPRPGVPGLEPFDFDPHPTNRERAGRLRHRLADRGRLSTGSGVVLGTHARGRGRCRGGPCPGGGLAAVAGAQSR
jgi:hypothetical protein